MGRSTRTPGRSALALAVMVLGGAVVKQYVLVEHKKNCQAQQKKKNVLLD